MASENQTTAEEIELFRGDVSLFGGGEKTAFGTGVVTSRRVRFFSATRSLEIEAEHLSSVEEERGILFNKLILSFQEGQTVALSAANLTGLRNALQGMRGQQTIESVLAARPSLSQVSNGYAWFAAFSPLVSIFLLALFFGGAGYNGVKVQILVTFIFFPALLFFFLIPDRLALERQGYSFDALGIAEPTRYKFYTYLFSRAKAFGHARSYAFVWCASTGIASLWLIKGWMNCLR